jgi:hypothetical protein
VTAGPIIATAGATAGSILALAGLFKWTKPVRSAVRKFSEFLDDWAGISARPGVDAQPGVMERLKRLETIGKATSIQVHNNGGESTRDAVGKILKATTGEDLTPVAPPEVDQ